MYVFVFVLQERASEMHVHFNVTTTAPMIHPIPTYSNRFKCIANMFRSAYIIHLNLVSSSPTVLALLHFARKSPPLVGNKATWLCQQQIRICSNILYHKNLISHTVISQKPSLEDTRCLKPLQQNTTRMVEGTAVVLGLCFYRGSSVSKAI